VLSGAGSRTDHLAALIASSAELSTFSRNLHHLTKLLRHGEFRPAQEYRPMLDTLGDDVRSHLALVAGALADLRPLAAKRSAAGPSCERLTFRSVMPQAPNIDGVLITWGDRLFYPGNRVVK
jgi:hypothetical protein